VNGDRAGRPCHMLHHFGGAESGRREAPGRGRGAATAGIRAAPSPEGAQAAECIT
jgi:hypothetical protein